MPRHDERMKTTDELAALETLGWTGAELARRADVTVGTVSRWRTGHTAMPGVVLAYLRLAMFIHQKGYRVP